MKETDKAFGSSIGGGQDAPSLLAAALFSGADEVLHHSEMTKAEKRAMLADWASDRRAVKGHPTLRQLDSGAVVEITDIMRALRDLDDGSARLADKPRNAAPFFAREHRLLRARWPWRRRGRKDHSDDDNQPPPCPAAACPRHKMADALPLWA